MGNTSDTEVSSAAQQNKNVIGQLRNISRSFGHVKALDSIDMDILAGETLAIVGENGTGKSTLMNILFGLESADTGNLMFKGKPGLFLSSNEAIKAGLGMVHQHFMLYPTLSVIENILAGAEGDGFLGLINFRARRRELATLIAAFGFSLDLDTSVQLLSVAARQQLEIVKMIFRGADVIILDEPTAVLTPQESEAFFTMVRKLRTEGKSIIIITHKLGDVMDNADRVIVLRSGKKVAELRTQTTDLDALSRLVVGHDITPLNKVSFVQPDQQVLEVRKLTVHNPQGRNTLPLLDNLSLHVRAGEILGIAGVSNNGQKAFVESITGLTRAHSGQILFNGQDITQHSIQQRRAAGLSYLAEDRMHTGLAVNASVAENLIASRENQTPFSIHSILKPASINAFARKVVADFAIRTTGPQQTVTALSGGNKQKIIVARELSNSPKLVVAENPCWGVDIAASSFIHEQLLSSVEHGAAVIFISSELEELFLLSDRLLVFFQGRINAEFQRFELDIHAVGKAMSAASDNPTAA